MGSRTEKIAVEPSAAAGFPGFSLIQNHSAYFNKIGSEALRNSTHIVWATSGSMVPVEEMQQYIERGNALNLL